MSIRQGQARGVANGITRTRSGQRQFRILIRVRRHTHSNRQTNHNRNNITSVRRSSQRTNKQTRGNLRRQRTRHTRVRSQNIRRLRNTMILLITAQSSVRSRRQGHTNRRTRRRGPRRTRVILIDNRQRSGHTQRHRIRRRSLGGPMVTFTRGVSILRYMNTSGGRR